MRVMGDKLMHEMVSSKFFLKNLNAPKMVVNHSNKRVNISLVNPEKKTLL